MGRHPVTVVDDRNLQQSIDAGRRIGALRWPAKQLQGLAQYAKETGP